MVSYRYSRWNGSQEAGEVHEDDLMDQFADQLMAHGDISTALRSLAQRGAQGKHGARLYGVQELLQKLRSQRQRILSQYDLDSVTEGIAERLRDIVHTEQQGIQQRLDEAASRLQEAGKELSDGTASDLLRRLEDRAAHSLAYLDQLPHDTAAAIRHLRSYDFTNPEARAKFDDLMQSLQQPFVDSHAKDLSERMKRMGPEEREHLKDMLADLNHMLEQRIKGSPAAGFEEFRQQHGRFFGQEPPQTLDDLLESMQRQAEHMRSLLRSMTPGQRQELQDILESVMEDDELREELQQLQQNLDSLSMRGQNSREYFFQGDDSLSLNEALDTIERLRRIEEMERQFRRTQHGGSVGDVDGRMLRELLGEEAAHHLAQLQRLTDILEEGGYVRKEGEVYHLTPRGTRRIGQKAMQELFAEVRKASAGTHAVHKTGSGGEWQREETKRYEFGDVFAPHLHRTLMNAVQRGTEGIPIKLSPQDFEVYQAKEQSQAHTVLMVDMSLSMAMRGNFLAAKKVALALHNLIRTQFPRDTLHVVGFSTYARDVKPEDLPFLGWDEFDPYTNIQHGLALAQKLLSRAPGNATKQIIMVSDGEPTAHVENGQLFLQYPPSPRTLRETLLEVQRCTRKGITINTFMLDSNRNLTEFVDRMTRINKGRVFYTRPEQLGHYILVDYFANRARRVLR